MRLSPSRAWETYSVPVVLLLCVACTTAELFTLATVGYMTGTALLGGGSWYQWNTLKDNTYCRFKECCNSRYIPYDIDELQRSLTKKMFGQPLVAELVNILSAHKASLNDDSRNRKALVISLHGWSGVGKNYASTMIADALYKNGMTSQYVLQFQGQRAIDSGNIGASRDALYKKISTVVSKCPTALIIFDEVHEMDPGIIDRIKPMLDHHRTVDGVDYRNALFIFISNIGGTEIKDELLKLFQKGVKREEVQFHDFEPIIRKRAFDIGGFEKAAIVANHLIDHYVPFLPLEQQHVEACARAEFLANGVYPSEAMMQEALKVITFGPEEKPLFANNGCKRFTKHIPFVVSKYKSNTKPKSEL